MKRFETKIVLIHKLCLAPEINMEFEFFLIHYFSISEVVGGCEPDSSINTWQPLSHLVIPTAFLEQFCLTAGNG